jgi:hypothetical protein
VARPLLAALLAAALLAACSGGDRPSTAEGGPTTTAAPDRLPPELEAFLDRAARSADTSVEASWDVLRKLEGVASTASVVAVPGGAARLTVGDLVVVLGERPVTCRPSVRACVDGVREDQLAAFGIFSTFWSTGPLEALRSAALRDDAGTPVTSTHRAAGITLECVAVPVGSALPATSCVTPEGVFGFVDNPSVRYELTSYRVGPPPPGALVVPFPVTDDDSFLTAEE